MKTDSKIVGWIRAVLRKYGAAFIAGLICAVLMFIGLNAALAPASKTEFCGGKCHSMHVAYRTWELSPHGNNKYGFRVECIDCHLPSKDNYFVHVTAKMYDGSKSMFQHVFGEEYVVEKGRKKALEHMPNKRCMHCHDNLLGKPGSSAARIAHLAVLNQPDAPESECVTCHEDVGHHRETKLFSQ